MKKETLSGLREKQGAYPSGPLMVAIAFAVSIYILWPFPDEPLVKLIQHQWFQHSFWVIFIIAVAQVWLISEISGHLDGKYRWGQRSYHRTIGQLLMGWIIPVVVSSLISWFWFQYLHADIHSIRYAYNRYMFKAIVDIALILNLAYLACSIAGYLKERLREETKELEIKSFPDHLYLPTPDGKQEIIVQVSDIAYICRKGKNTLLRAQDGRAFIFWESLDKVEKQLDPDQFYRISRAYIINRKAVRSWQKQADRSLLLEVRPQNVEPVKISRDRAGRVVSWIKKEALATNDHSNE